MNHDDSHFCGWHPTETTSLQFIVAKVRSIRWDKPRSPLLHKQIAKVLTFVSDTLLITCKESNIVALFSFLTTASIDSCLLLATLKQNQIQQSSQDYCWMAELKMHGILVCLFCEADHTVITKQVQQCIFQNSKGAIT